MKKQLNMYFNLIYIPIVYFGYLIPISENKYIHGFSHFILSLLSLLIMFKLINLVVYKKQKINNDIKLFYMYISGKLLFAYSFVSQYLVDISKLESEFSIGFLVISVIFTMSLSICILLYIKIEEKGFEFSKKINNNPIEQMNLYKNIKK